MHKKPFIADYTSMTVDGAEWVVNKSDIQLVGIDYTSIAIYEDLKGPHLTLLPNVSLIPAPESLQVCFYLQQDLHANNRPVMPQSK